jgi:hypothetical protein
MHRMVKGNVLNLTKPFEHTIVIDAMSRYSETATFSFSTPVRDMYKLISEMAGHIAYGGRRLGRLMIDWVVSKALDLSQYAACRLVVVESVEDKVETYRQWGFEPIEEKRNMFLRIS